MAEKTETPKTMVAHDIELLGRTIHVAPFISLGMDRIRLMLRIVDRIQRGIFNPDDLLKMDKLFGLLISEEDDRWLENQVLDGKLTTEQIINALVGTFMEPTDKPVAKAVRAARGR